MNHRQALELLSGHLDRELSLSEARAFERYLDSSAKCRETYAQYQIVRVRLRQASLYIEAPQALRQRIETALPHYRAPLMPLRVFFGRFAGYRVLALLPIGATAISLAALSLSLSLYLATPSSDQRLTQELVGDHVRSLQSDHLFDVVSTNQHTVKPWFNGKLDFAPPVIDLAQQGYPLLGGRLDFINGRAVAVMVYRYQLYPINLYIWPGSDAGTQAHVFVQEGYHLAHWSAAGVTYWVVTDAGAAELNGFISNLRAQAES